MPWVLPPVPVNTATQAPGRSDSALQFDAPFRLDANGHAVTVEQGSAEEIGAAIYNVLICPQGAKLDDPDFGVPVSPFALLPLDTATIVRQVQKIEPRAVSVEIEQRIASLRETLLNVSAEVSPGGS